jgi:hypothetical protein
MNLQNLQNLLLFTVVADPLRENLAQGKYHGATARPDLVDGEALNRVIALCLRAAAVGRRTPKLRDVRDAFEKPLSPKKMFAVKSKAKPHVVLTPSVQNIVKDPVEVKVEPVPSKLERLVKQEPFDYETDYSLFVHL